MNIRLNSREYIIGEGYNYQITLMQCEIERLIKILDSVNSNTLSMRFKMLIFIRDYNEGTKTSFADEPYKGDIRRLVMSPYDYGKFIGSQRDFLKKMEAYYGTKKTA